MKVAKGGFSSLFLAVRHVLVPQLDMEPVPPAVEAVLTTGPSGKPLFFSFYVFEDKSEYSSYRASDFIGNQFLKWLWQIYGYCLNRLSKQLEVFVWEPGAELENTMAKCKCANRPEPPQCNARLVTA